MRFPGGIVWIDIVNAVAGTLVPVALPGTQVPSGTVVRDGKIAGEAAQGMLCSADELLQGEERVPRIMLLEQGEPGESLARYFPLEAIFEAENSGQPAGTVVEVLQPGYVLHDRLLRPAMVGVAKG